MITFVIFHIELGERRRQALIPSCRGVPVDYLEMVDLAFRSAEMFHPNCRKVILTDRATDFSGLPEGIGILRHEIDPTRVMFERTLVQQQFLAQHDFDSHVLLMDSDMLINNRLDSCFDVDFDVGLTYRGHPDMPINGGLIAVRNSRRGPSLAFFDSLVRIMWESYSQDLTWFCDQHALIEAVGRAEFGRRPSDTMETPSGVRIQLWPCETHNYSPDNQWHRILWRDARRRIMHFKGERKRLMKPYWSTHLSGDETRAGKWSRRAEFAGRALGETIDARLQGMTRMVGFAKRPAA